MSSRSPRTDDGFIGTPQCLLDIVEVTESHTGVVLADTFFEVLKAFGIEKKVRFSSTRTNGHSPEWQVLSITASCCCGPVRSGLVQSDIGPNNKVV
jgi:hypothetical protein